jgi:excinuclease ABC subunit A
VQHADRRGGRRDRRTLDLDERDRRSPSGCSRRSTPGSSSCSTSASLPDLHRRAATLSGGEAQRIRLASQIGSGSSACSTCSTSRRSGCTSATTTLIETLQYLRDLGNTVLVVEHDEDTIKVADWSSTSAPARASTAARSSTRARRRPAQEPEVDHRPVPVGQAVDPVPEVRRTPGDDWISIKGAREHNLRNVDVDIPLGCFVAVTGVSGSGKSRWSTTSCSGADAAIYGRRSRPACTSDHRHRAARQGHQHRPVADRAHPAVEPGHLHRRVRPHPQAVRQTTEAKVRGYLPGRFSFNVKGGRCEACAGDGTIKIEMHFLPDVYVPCEVCKGNRYNRDTLDILFKGKNIAEVLDLRVEEALEFFANQPRSPGTCRRWSTSGSATCASASRPPRCRAARPSASSSPASSPSGPTGPHDLPARRADHRPALRGRAQAARVLTRLVDQGNTVLVIEHNLDVIKTADWIIDLGPEGGSGGGTVVGDRGRGSPAPEFTSAWSRVHSSFEIDGSKYRRNFVCTSLDGGISPPAASKVIVATRSGRSLDAVRITRLPKALPSRCTVAPSNESAILHASAAKSCSVRPSSEPVLRPMPR